MKRSSAAKSRRGGDALISDAEGDVGDQGEGSDGEEHEAAVFAAGLDCGPSLGLATPPAKRPRSVMRSSQDVVDVGSFAVGDAPKDLDRSG